MKKNLLTLLIPFFLLISGYGQSTGLQLNNLRCEYRTNPVGMDVTTPRLSWVLSSKENDQRQTAYRIIVASSPEKISQNKGDLWDSGIVKSTETIHISYKGQALTSRMKAWWKVQVVDKKGKVSAWSETAQWSMGLLKSSDWKAQWIADIRDKRIEDAGAMPVTMVRNSFKVKSPVKRATVYVSGLGIYELEINGKKVGDQLLAPEFTDYDERLQYQTQDVTKHLVVGENGAGAFLGDGWNGEHFFGMTKTQAQRPFGGRRGFIMQLEIEYADGTRDMVISDKSWKSTKEGPIRMSSLYNGERYDARQEMPGWSSGGGFDDSLWHPVIIADYIKNPNLIWRRNEPIKVVKEIKPISMSQPKPNVFVYDLGQNMVGWVRMKVKGRMGSKVKLRFAEMLNEDGTVYMDNLRAAEQTDTYIKRTSANEYFEPRFTYHGFRYVEVTGVDYRPVVFLPRYKPHQSDIVGRVFHSSSPNTGKFKTSSDFINKIMHMIVWVQRGNMHSVPTDCPQRDERAGWMGDIQAFSQTAMYNMDMAGFFSKWIPDVRDAQLPDGRYSNFTPMDSDRFAGGTPAWADAGTIIPWRMYQNYADKRMLAEHYESAKKWVDYVHSNNSNLLWNRKLGSAFNDWLNADTLEKENWPKKGGAIPPRVLSTCFFSKSAEIVGKMAAVLGKEADAEKYSALSAGIKKSFLKHYVDKKTGKISGDTQAGYALALRFNMLPKEMRPQTAKYMLEGFKRYGGHMSTGIQTSHRLMLELTRNGYHHEACRLLNLKTIPSWGFMVEQGATTIWERWDGYIKGSGFQAPRMNSFNHWALGAVGEWMWRHIIGLHPDENNPGWEHFTIAPLPGGGLTWANGEYESIRGLIKSSWEIKNKKFILKVTVPPNTSATIRIPADKQSPITLDGKVIKPQLYINGCAVLEVKSGVFQLTSEYSK